MSSKRLLGSEDSYRSATASATCRKAISEEPTVQRVRRELGRWATFPLECLRIGSSLGTLGLEPRILNVSLVDISENLTPKSAITAAGGYAFTHFYGNDVATGTSFIDSSQASAQVGYNRILTPRTQIALVYGYQGFNFSFEGTAFHTHIIQALYGHRISGRMDLLIGAGPQFTFIGSACTEFDALTGNPHCSINPSGVPVGSIPNTKVGVAAQARLRYKFTKAR